MADLRDSLTYLTRSCHTVTYTPGVGWFRVGSHICNVIKNAYIHTYYVRYTSPHLCVGFLFLVLHSCLLLPSSSFRSHTTCPHTTCHHTTCSHTPCPHQLVLTQLVHTQLVHHTSCHHTTCSHNLLTHTQLAHTQLVTTQLHHTTSHTQLVTTQLTHT